VILTAGQQEQGHGLLEPMLYEPLVPVAQPLVKWAVEVTRAADLPRILHRAAKIALTPPTGPVFLSLPGDILKSDGDIDLLEPTRVAPRVRGDIDAVNAQLLVPSGKLGAHLRENEWLMAIKQRTGIPGGACEFDLPSYHFWLHRPAEERIGQLAAWTGPLFPLRDGTAIILRILRESGKPQKLSAPLGTFQQMLGGKTAQMLRVRLDPAANCVPEISANKYVLNIRYLTQANEDPKPRTADWDVAFELTFCNL